MSSQYHPLPTSPVEEVHDIQELQSLEHEDAGDGGTKRALQTRHISMIALAGMIGTGLFLSSGRALAQSGPLGCLLAFSLMGSVTASIALISAEMSSFKPVGGGFVRHATLWFDESMGIAIGWNFWYAIAITMPTEITAATVLMGYWFPNMNQAIPITVFLVAIAVINFSPVQIYGEFEFFFAISKITLIIFFIITGVLCDLGAVGHERIGFRYWSDPYPLFNEYIVKGVVGKMLGFWATMLFAAFAFGNVQVVATAGAETKNPRRTIPAALKQTFWRILVFYVASVFVISLLVPADDEHLRLGTDTVAHSPFVIALDKIGSRALPSIVNAVVVASAFSSGNSCTFLASRTLHGMALDGHAPQIFLCLNRFQVPYVAVGVTAAWGLVAYSCLNKGAFQAFTWLVSLVTTSGLVSWVVICITYLRFYRALQNHKINRTKLPYCSPWQPYSTYYALIMVILILVFCGLEAFLPTFKPAEFFSAYFNSLAFPLLYFLLKKWNGDTLSNIDQDSIEEELLLIDAERWKEHSETGVSYYDRILNTFF